MGVRFKHDNIDVWEDSLTEALRLEKDGLKLGQFALGQARHLERMFGSPIAVYGQPFSRAGWKQVVARLRRLERKTPFPEEREGLRTARIMASKMPPTASPWDAMKCLWELHRMGGIQACDGRARRHMREACYYVMNKEFIGRDVG